MFTESEPPCVTVPWLSRTNEVIGARLIASPGLPILMLPAVADPRINSLVWICDNEDVGIDSEPDVGLPDAISSTGVFGVSGASCTNPPGAERAPETSLYSMPIPSAVSMIPLPLGNVPAGTETVPET